jgi:hypothetical protein
MPGFALIASIEYRGKYLPEGVRAPILIYIYLYLYYR